MDHRIEITKSDPESDTVDIKFTDYNVELMASPGYDEAHIYDSMVRYARIAVEAYLGVSTIPTNPPLPTPDADLRRRWLNNDHEYQQIQTASDGFTVTFQNL